MRRLNRMRNHLPLVTIDDLHALKERNVIAQAEGLGMNGT
jgi:hypothetical protein